MRLIAITALLALSACGRLETPESRYLALTVGATAATNVANEYVSDCKTKPPADQCYKRFPEINAAAKATLKAKKQADKVFITKDSEYYTLSLSVLENATNSLSLLLKE